MAAIPQLPKIIHLTLGGTQYNLDVIDAEVVPTPPDVLSVKTLDGFTHQDVGTAPWSLRLKMILDYSSTRPGLAYYLKENAGDLVAFVLNVYDAGTATGHATSPPISGNCRLIPVSYGGDGNAYGEHEVLLPISGEPTLDITP